MQRIIESHEYEAYFPETAIKRGSKPPGYIRTADEAEIIGRRGSLLSVGREGALTGNRVDCFILDDLYKDAMEAHSPVVRANCWEWYTSVVRTRMHNASRELVVFTRWHEEDLIGTLAAREPVVVLRAWAQLEAHPADAWLHLDFEALKTGPPSEVDPRLPGEALWEAQHGAALLEAKRRLDPVQFEALYQGRPSVREGLLYGMNFAEYDELPPAIVRRGNYTDTADTGDDYLCSICYAVDSEGRSSSPMRSIRASRWRSPNPRSPRCCSVRRRARRLSRATTEVAASRAPCSAVRPACGSAGSTRAATRRPASSPTPPRRCGSCAGRGAGIGAGPTSTRI